MKIAATIPILLILSIVMVSGCTSSTGPAYSGESNGGSSQPSTAAQTPSSSPAQTATNVVTVELMLPQGKSWDADPEIDGIEVYVSPKDANDKLVKAEGTLDAKLWTAEYDYSTMERVKGDLIGEWSNVAVRSSNYDYLGSKVRLEFSDYESSGLQTGILEVTFKTSGKEFSARSTAIISTS